MDLATTYPERAATESERDFFKRRPDVAGYAADDKTVVLNPFAEKSDQWKASILKNERIRQYLRDYPKDFSFPIASHQEEWAKNNEYGKDKGALQQSIVARILAGDDSLAPYHPAQLRAAQGVDEDIYGPSQSDDILIKTAREQFPILNTVDFDYKYSPLRAPGFLETWPADEEGTPEYPRPAEFPVGRLGVEVFDPNTRPIDILGDVVSHHLKDTEPYIKRYYQNFEESLTPEQKNRLKRQYDYAVRKEGEERPFEQWYERTGLPGYFRGYAFQQWDGAEQLYTPKQRQMFDQMMDYLRSQR